MIEWIFTVLVLYLLYKLIFDFIIPVTRVSSQIRSKVNEMNQQQYHQQQRQRPSQNQRADEKVNVRPPADDYIDFEEIK
jgi:hypothetical protein